MKKLYPKLKFVLLLFLIGVVLTAAFTWPYITKLTTFYYDRGDYQLTGGALAYNEFSIRTGKIFNRDTYFNGYQFYPQAFSLVYSDLRLVPSLIYSPIYWLTNNFVLSVNLTTFSTFIITFMSSFYSFWFFTRHKLASLIGAIIFTFNPLTFSRFPEHFELLNKYFIPLVFLFAYRFFTSPTIKNAFFLGLFFTLNAFSAVYFQIFTMVTLPIFLLPILGYKIYRQEFSQLLKVFRLLPVLLIFIPVFWYFDNPYLRFSELEGSKRSLEENSFYSARLIDYISSTPSNWFYGSFVKSIEAFRAPQVKNSAYGAFNYQEHTLFLNIIPLLLLVFFLVKFKGQIKKVSIEKKLQFWSFLTLLLVTFSFTLGPFFQGWNGEDSNFPLPFYYLYQHLSLFQGIRAPTRISFIFYFPFALFITWGLSYLLQGIKKEKLRYLIFSLIIALLWVENFTPEPMERSYQLNSPILKQVEKLQASGNKLSFLENKRTLHVPLIYDQFNDVESVYLNWAALTREIIINGNRGSYLSSEQAMFIKQLEENIDENTLRKLYALGVDYIIFHKDVLGQDLGKYSKQTPLFDRGAVNVGDNLLIVDLKRYHFLTNVCDFPKDMEFGVQIVSVSESGQVVHMVNLKNKNNCYFPAVYLDKYQQINFYVNFIKRTVHLKLPVIIEPYQTVSFSEIYNNLRWE